ncbi:Exopolysaccharide synthesis, ExoD [Rhodovulum sp. PH10]|uniref:exopolysaccharide biosynthesis protein n=1 Tax=Rhodovulum sp. PH10 TaxID=1187851 RepID=UPI00027C2D60|nr:exopolysaccharide biosynthesis protein [Rhodovulum sp. PH10]EJW09963.1 Exopolysaccharide synthesis, ExoD [Rhodovulum sp. PH10]
MQPGVPTSVALARLLAEAPPDRVSLAWLIGRLGPRSFGLLVLVLALLGLAPGVAFVTGFVLAFAAFQMMLGYDCPRLPRAVTDCAIPTRHFTRWTNRAIAFFARLERMVGRRPQVAFPGAGRLVGLVVLLLAATIVWPIPFSHIIPTFAIMLVAFAYMENDRVLLGISLVATVLSFSTSAAMVWGVLEGGSALIRYWVGG